jgi:hypothetical protein
MVSGLKQRSDFVPLNTTRANVKSFDCGKEPINRFLYRFAANHMGSGLSGTFILPYKQEESTSPKLSIAAFYTLANHALSPEQIPTSKSLPRFDTPVVLLAQLGVNLVHQGQGLGAIALVTALQHAYGLATNPNGIPSFGVILDAIDDQALEFYNSFEIFIPFVGMPRRLFIPMQSIEPLLVE